MFCSSISALKRAYDHLPTRPDGRAVDPIRFLNKILLFSDPFWAIFLTARATIGARYAHGEVKDMRFYHSDFHLIFDGGEISDFRVPRVYIWLNCAFL